MDFDTLKSIAPREHGHVELPNGDKLDVYSLDMSGRLGGAEFLKENANDTGKYFAYCAVHGCPALQGKTPEEVDRDLDPLVVASIGNKVLELSGLTEEKMAEAEKNSESDPI